ncbi:haloalkane dehalogenase [Parahalioglobus pacificus]|uniref:Haloalkane dehalogenase n=1 Tax=Parahalioglobus pacificus TaxID=930806 RepID=A0A918XBP8_9GAMM|nr:haloalkane dehalogenase [Halioglobus pacificus]NQY04371.1 haloalkane dehalogenase [Halieaceae bacterium]GHD25271.1 haloalkane dehalogenase [Halioglobus pacificus]
MEFKRTPDACFENLANFPYEPHYLQVDDTEGGSLRLAYIDEGPADAPVVLLMHGQPAWSYLYRHMMPALLENGFRVIAPDLIGFGRSDKPTQEEDYTYARHVAWMSDWLTQLDLTGITVFFQDWGSLIGLRLVAAFPERFAGVVLSNGGLPAGVIPEEFSQAIRDAYASLPVVKTTELGERFRDTSGIPGIFYWRKYCELSEELADVGHLFRAFDAPESIVDEMDGFSVPFPDATYLSGARKFPRLIPLLQDEAEVQENKAAWKVLANFDKPFMLAFSDDDPVTAGGDAAFLKAVPGCEGIAHRTIGPAGHFVQQEQPEQCVQAILDITGLYD